MKPNVVDAPSASKTNNAIASRGFRALTLVKADDGSVQLPTRIEVMRAGTWPDSVKGNLVISTADLQEMKQNFDQGKAQPFPGFGVPIDFSHEEWSQAAGWIKGLVVEGDVLYADPVEWSKAGEDALRGGLYKCFSPAFYPSCLGDWYDPEDFTNTARNVLEGGGLTNMPFFKDLHPIMASNSKKEGGDKNVIYIKASNKEEENLMNLAEIVAKENDSLSEDERTFLSENKAELSEEQLTKFGFEAVKSEENKEQEEQEQEEEAPVAVENSEEVKLPEAVTASLKQAGVVLVKADRLAALEASAKDYQNDKAEQEVAKHIARGAIKADQKESWTKRIVADNTVTELLKNLPDNQVLASEIGKSETGSDKTSAWENIRVEAAKIVADTNGKTSFGDAVKEVQKLNPALAEAYKDERDNK